MAHRPSDGRPRRSNRTGSRYLSRAPCYHVKAPSRTPAYNFVSRALAAIGTLDVVPRDVVET